jgi:hypothetical protein
MAAAAEIAAEEVAAPAEMAGERVDSDIAAEGVASVVLSPERADAAGMAAEGSAAFGMGK